jgi:HK97 family phage prohead protease
MGAIAIHHTAVSAGAWNGPEAESRLKLDGTEAYCRQAFAWQDPAGDAQTKAAYKFIHHEVSADGTVGAANIRACQTGIGVLNGGRGGTVIAAADRRGVHAHLAAHLADAELEAPPLRSAPALVEHRAYPIQELQVEDGEQAPHIRGYAAVFDSLSLPMNAWGPTPVREKIRPGAFAKTLRESDVRALWNHDPSYVLGRNKASTLGLREDEHGLAVDITPPATQWARDLAVSMRRGDVNQMSFGFQVVRDEWERGHDPTGDNQTRTLLEVKLFDVSVVTFPAYPATNAGLRDMWSAMAEDSDSEIESIGQPLQAEHLPADIAAPEPTISTPSRTGHLLRVDMRRVLDQY